MTQVIGRWTTPELHFKLPFDASATEELSIVFKQAPYPQAECGFLFDKHLDDCVIDGDTITLKLTTTDTRKLAPDRETPIFIQIRIRISGEELQSKIMQADPYLVLKDGAINADYI